MTMEEPSANDTGCSNGSIDSHDSSTDQQHHHASVSQTIINMSKTCMGTGCLALPFAAQRGGIIVHVLGLLGLGIWNVITVQKLCQCYELIQINNNVSTKQGSTDKEDNEETMSLWALPNAAALDSSNGTLYYDSLDVSTKDVSENINGNNINNAAIEKQEQPPKGMTTLVQLAWYALGPWGASCLDIIMVLYLIGVIVTYLNALRSFLSDTPFTTGLGFVDSFLLVAIMGPLSTVPHTGHLAQASAMGLLVLLLTFIVIAWYGFMAENEEDAQTWQVMTGEDVSASQTATMSSLRQHDDTDTMVHHTFWLPENGLAGISQWFGICVFGFGIVPLAFTFRESMKEPQKLVPATWWAMVVVAISYIVLGVGLLMLYPEIESDVLHELPSMGWVPTLTRIAMVLVVLVTAPLLIVPCGELLEGKIASHNHTDENDSNEDVTSSFHNHHTKTHWRLKAIVRWSICLICAAISTFVPGFVNVLSFVGCCCVAVVGFCVPPCLHLILSVRYYKYRSSNTTPKQLPIIFSMAWDVALLLWGLLATVVSTAYTFWELSS